MLRDKGRVVRVRGHPGPWGLPAQAGESRGVWGLQAQGVKAGCTRDEGDKVEVLCQLKQVGGGGGGGGERGGV